MNNDENHPIEQSRGQFLVYQAEDGRTKLDVRLEDEAVWLTQGQGINWGCTPILPFCF